MRPGVDVISRALPAPASPPTNTAIAFIVGPTANPSPQQALISSLTEFVDTFGDRGTGPAQVTYDAVDVYFREGGGQCYVSSTTGTGTRAAEGLAAEESKTKTKTAAKDAPEQLAVDPGIVSALAALNASLGPGQILIADPTLAAAPANQSALLAHAATHNRAALLSCADGTATALEAVGNTLNDDANARYGALFAPSAIVPGVVAGTTRTVPYSCVEAGIIARNDISYGPNQPAAGVLGQAVYAIDLYDGGYSDSDYETLNDASVNMAKIIYGGVRTYGYRSCVDSVATPEWLDFGNVRLNMQIVAECEAVGENFVFAQIDGRGFTIAQFGTALEAVLAPLYEAGELYGTTYADAYEVNVGSQVNTPETIANGELHAVLSVRMSPFAEWVEIEIVKVATTQTLPPVSAVAA